MRETERGGRSTDLAERSLGYLRFIADNWRLLLFGMLLTGFSSFGQTFFIALFGAEIRGAFGLSHGGFGSIYAGATLASAATIVWLGALIDRTDLRLFAGCVTAAMSAACLIMAATPSVIVLAFALFALRLTGQGLSFHTAMTAMARHFQAERGRAIGVATMGFPIAEAGLPILAVTGIALLGWRTTWLVSGILVAVILVPAVVLLLNSHNRRQGSTARRNEDDSDSAHAPRSWSRREVVGDYRFYIILSLALAPSFIVTGFFFHLTHMATEKGWSLALAATSFTAFAICSFVSLLAMGRLVDRVGARRLMPIYLIPTIAALLLIAVADHPAIAFGFMICLGVGVGVTNIVLNALWAELYGVGNIGAIRAMVFALIVFASALSPPVMGWLIDYGVTVEAIALGCLTYCVAATAFAATMGRRIAIADPA
ncbi:MAG: MFS transporter [Pseudomonadota bacterium]